MDWSLVLISQGIESTVDQEGSGWVLRVPAGEAARAASALALYERENPRIRWRRVLPGTDLLFHGAVFGWSLLLVAMHLTLGDPDSLWRKHALMDVAAVRAGQWWRAATAVWLHADLRHLASNLTAGTVFLGLAMARFRVGPVLLGSLLAGIGGNLLVLAVCEAPRVSLGASGAVLGALGMLAGGAAPLWIRSRRAARGAVATLGAGAFLFLLWGTDPGADVVAHLGGFATGAVLGVGFSLITPRQSVQRAFALAAWLIWAGVVLAGVAAAWNSI
jgi:membrane associated rhomboid family serine protease